MGYYDIFTSNREDLIELNSSGYDMVLISNENYVTLFKNKDLQGMWSGSQDSTFRANDCNKNHPGMHTSARMR